MTVDELKAALAELPGSARVFTYSDGYQDITEVVPAGSDGYVLLGTGD